MVSVARVRTIQSESASGAVEVRSSERGKRLVRGVAVELRWHLRVKLPQSNDVAAVVSEFEFKLKAPPANSGARRARRGDET